GALARPSGAGLRARRGALPIVGGRGRAEVAVGGRAADAVGGDDPVAGALGLHRAAADGRRVGAVIGLVGGRDRGGHRALADVGGGRGGDGAQLVVALVGAGQGDVGGDLLAVGGGGRAERSEEGRAAREGGGVGEA